MGAGGNTQRLTPANEDYLEAIYEIGGTKGAVRSVDLATKLDVSKASVNHAIKYLKEVGYVEQPHYGDITLTKKGAAYAAGVSQRHHVLSRFLVDVLGVDPEVASVEACEMEHAISDDTLQRLTAHLKGLSS